MSEPSCPSCSVAYIDHLGLNGTCANLKELRLVLRIIYTWATFREGEELVPEHVAALIAKRMDLIKEPK